MLLIKSVYIFLAALCCLTQTVASPEEYKSAAKAYELELRAIAKTLPQNVSKLVQIRADQIERSGVFLEAIWSPRAVRRKTPEYVEELRKTTCDALDGMVRIVEDIRGDKVWAGARAGSWNYAEREKTFVSVANAWKAKILSGEYPPKSGGGNADETKAP